MTIGYNLNKEKTMSNIPIRVILADDHAVVRHGFRMILDSQADMEVIGEVANDDAGEGAAVGAGFAACLAAAMEPDRCYRDLEERARLAFARQADGVRVTLYRTADVRYLGQNHELTVEAPAGPFDEAALAAVKDVFHAAHRELFGYASLDKEIELVTFRVRARLAGGGREFGGAAPGGRAGALRPIATRSVYFGEAGFVACPIFERDGLREGDRLAGPAIVEQMDCTTVVPPGFTARVDAFLNLLLRSDA
jgi:N-methylhydantoinase A